MLLSVLAIAADIVHDRLSAPGERESPDVATLPSGS